MTRFFFFPLILSLVSHLNADTLLIDCNDGSSPTQSGWESLSSNGGTWAETYGAITVDIDATGGPFLDDRLRSNNGGGSESSMWADFVFANDPNANGIGFDVIIAGLQANTEYPITIWSYDRGSTGNRSSAWSANDGGGAFVAKGTNSFNGSNSTPQSLTDYALSFDITTDGVGAITLRGEISPSGVSNSHNVFLNGLRIGDPAVNSTDSDDDDLIDQWELQFFPNLMVATGSGNNDGDTLTNNEEEDLGTNPTLADTDNDNLLDHLEISSNTNPLIPDTDDDGLLDGDEISGTSGFVTNPLLADTDGDSFNDQDEITAGTDPTNGNDFPNGLPLRISEFLANNFDNILDGFGEHEDWIEIQNPNGVAINLDGYSLTDDPLLPQKWTFPAITIPANNYLLVFASGRNLTADSGGRPHTNFKLSNDGEYLALIRDNGTVIEDQYAPIFPRQFVDISYGQHPTNNTLRFFGTPTPGAVNNAGFDEVVLDTSFSIDRGLKTAPFSLAISSATPGASIRYTTDGSKPSANSGTLYTNPINISTTTTVRAIAYKANALSTNVDTHTYIFTDQVVDQPANPTGWPSDWITGQYPTRPADYEMDPRVKNGAIPGYSVQEALEAIPTLSLVLPQNDFTGSSGIYMNPESRGSAWERECSLELIYPDGSSGFQENCQVEIHGNSSRRPARMQKHSMRITFKKEFGTGTLRFPLIEGASVERFNKLVLRACFTDSWGLASWSPTRYRPNDSQYFRDVWMKESLRDMGQPSSSGTFMHLYVNGLYWGLYNPTERIEAEMLAENYGGSDEDWEVNEDLTGKDARYLTMEALANNLNVPANYDAIQPYIDVENFADYIFLHSYADVEDWPNKNGYAAANINPATGDLKYRFFVWDQEIALDKFTWRRYNDSRNVGGLFQEFRANADFRQLFADRAAKHLFNNGALSLANSQARYLALANRIDQAIVAESARWGDTQFSTPYGNSVDQSGTNIDDDAYPAIRNSLGNIITNPADIYFTRENAWVIERDNILNHQLPVTNSTSDSRGIIPKLRTANLYPSIDPPVFSQHGGSIGNGITLTITGTGTLYYTTDGSDPRLSGGGINPGAASVTGSALVTIDSSLMVKARSQSNGEWSALTEAAFSANDLVIAELMYHPTDPSGDAEFIEILNVGSQPVQLEGYILDTAFDPFIFPAYQLDPNQRALVIKDQAIFESIYGTGMNSLIVGTYNGALKNSTETIRLAAPDNTTVHQLTYYDSQERTGVPNWPAPADGQGYSLTLDRPLTNPDHNEVSSWRISRMVNGSPGTDDLLSFNDWASVNGLDGTMPSDDSDSDGFQNFSEFAFGMDPNTPTPRVETSILSTSSGTQFRFRRQIATTQVSYLIEYSEDLQNWHEGELSLISTTPSNDGTALETWQLSPTFASMPDLFLRVRAEFTP